MWHVPLSLALLEMAGQIVDAKDNKDAGKDGMFDLDLDLDDMMN